MSKPTARAGEQAARAGEQATSIRYRMMDLAAQMHGVISLGRGDPDLDTPQEILDLIPPRAEYSAPRSPVQGLRSSGAP